MKRNNIKIFGCLTAVIGFILFICVFAWTMAPGSYARAETYEFDIPEDSLIAIIEEVKNENPDINLIKEVNIQNGKNFKLIDGRSDELDYWYSIYFYYPDKNEILHTWTRPNSERSTTFAFVGINSGLSLGNWKTINESFWWWKNKPDVEEFENRILNKIKEKTKAQHSL
jgi:hypothetical protein